MRKKGFTRVKFCLSSFPKALYASVYGDDLSDLLKVSRDTKVIRRFNSINVDRKHTSKHSKLWHQFRLLINDATVISKIRDIQMWCRTDSLNLFLYVVTSVTLSGEKGELRWNIYAI